MLGGGRRLLGRHAPHLLAVPCSLLVPRLRPSLVALMSPLLQQERGYKHVKGAGAVQKGDGKIRAKKAAMRTTSTEGVYVGRIVASFGKEKLDVVLHDGREVRCKAAGRLQKERVRLRVGDAVRVKYNLDVDEDGQTPSIIGLDIDE
jgi:translation initiation factor IF-1